MRDHRYFKQMRSIKKYETRMLYREPKQKKSIRNGVRGLDTCQV